MENITEQENHTSTLNYLVNSGSVDLNLKNKTEDLSENFDPLHTVFLKQGTSDDDSLEYFQVGEVTKFSCYFCDAIFGRKFNLQKHLISHEIVKLLECEICDFNTTKRMELQRHCLTVHFKDQPFECEICNYKTGRKINLKFHVKNHASEKPFSCGACDYKTTKKRYLLEHSSTHSGDKPFACDVCDYKTARKRGLQEHSKIHMSMTGKPFLCGLCDYQTVQVKDAKEHLRSHTGEKSFTYKLANVA